MKTRIIFLNIFHSNNFICLTISNIGHWGNIKTLKLVTFPLKYFFLSKIPVFYQTETI